MRPACLWLPLLLLASPAAAHDLPAAEMARLNALVAQALDGGWGALLLLLGSGLALGALHGLEPGHAKTMMSAFIVAIRGTVGQAALLGASATVAHTAVVWLLVVPVLVWGGPVDLAGREPYFQIASAVAVLAVAGWTLARVVRAGRRAPADAVADPAARTLDTGHGLLRVEIVQRNDMWRFVARGVARSGRTIPFHENLTIGIFRPDGSRQAFTFSEQDDILIAEPPVLPPHDFVAELLVGHADHEHAFEVPFGAATVEPQGDAHERAHAADLARRLAEGRPLTRWQIVLFGLSGGLLPCPAAVTVLLLCLQLRQVGLGLLLVGSFSLGLAFTMIASGVVASVGVRRLGGRSGVFAAWARPATYASCALILAIGLYMLAEGIDALA